jgi:hypothetical protein
MNDQDYLYHLQNLYELDVDQLCSDLRLTTADIIHEFPEKVTEFLNKEFG